MNRNLLSSSSKTSTGFPSRVDLQARTLNNLGTLVWSGAVDISFADGAVLRPIAELRAPHAHSVAVDPRTHLVYLPLENVDGKPVLRILTP